MQMLEILKNKIAEVVIKFDKNRDFYEKNETATRDQLINPLLIALGWDTTNPDFVRPNERDKGFKIPDYKMFKDANTVLVLEAKKAALQISTKEITQLCTYIYTENVNFGLISNGLYWALLEKDSKTKIWELDFRQTQDSWETEARLLLNVAYDNVEKLENSIRKNALLENFYIENLQDQSTFLAFLHRQILKIDGKIEFGIDEISNFLDKKGFFQTTETPTNSPSSEKENIVISAPTKPTLKVTFPDGTIIYEKKASQTMVKTVQKIGAKKVYDLKIAAAGFYLVDNQNPEGASLEWHSVGGGLWLNTSHSNDRKKRLLNSISEMLGVNLLVEII